MTAVLVTVMIVLGISLATLGRLHLSYRRWRPHRPLVGGARRILFPFVANALSQPGLDASLRLARAEEATLVPVFLARVSLDLPLDTALPRQSRIAIPLQEAIERRATSFGITVDARIERGRTQRHALRLAFEHERYDRIVIAAAAHNSPGFSPDDVAWLLANAPGEIVVLRPDRDEVLRPPEGQPGRARNGRMRSRAAKMRETG